MREVITLQFGDYAHHVGAHYWNFQDELLGDPSGELDASILYDVHEDAAGRHATATPRLLLFDAAGSAGLLRAGRGAAGMGAVQAALAAGTRGGGEHSRLASLVGPYVASRLRTNPLLQYLEEEEEGEEEGEGDDRSTRGAGASAAFATLEDRAAAARAAAQAPLEALDLNGVVSSWADYCKATLHTRSLVGVGGRNAIGDAVGRTSSDVGAGLRSGSASFDAFPDGCGLSNDACEEAARVMLERCETVSGFQVVVDVDSGWGGFAVEYLTALRDECPRVPLLVFGATRPHARSCVTSTLGVGSVNYGGRTREHLRRCNLALSFAHFAGGSGGMGGGGAGGLDATFIPLSLQAAFDARAAADAADASHSRTPAAAAVRAAAASWFPGLLSPDASASPYISSALLATAWDAASLPYRRSAGGPVGGSFAPGERGSGGGGGNGGTAGSDHRMRGSGGGGGGSGGGVLSSSSNDPHIEHGSCAPLVALARGLTVSEYTHGLLRGGGGSGGHLRIATISLALPMPHPRLTATGFARLLAHLPPASVAGPDVFAPLSWTGALPVDAYTRPRTAMGARASASSSRESGLGGPRHDAPFAHALIARGIGSSGHAASGSRGIGSGGGHESTIDAYGRALDAYLARDGCRSAGHAVVRTPLPVPLTLPHFFTPYTYDAHGGLARRALRESSSSALPPTTHAAIAAGLLRVHGDAGDGGGEDDDSHAGGADEGVALPFTVPLLAHVSCTPAYAPALARLHSDFLTRDKAMDARFGVDSAGSGGGASSSTGTCSIDFAEAAAALACLVDDYAVTR